jgi:hypothetical protein
MKRNKFKDLVSIASKSVNLPEIIIIEEMEVDKYIYLQDDTLNPIILTFSNFISNKILNRDLFKINVTKTEESLCYAKIMEDGEDDSDDKESEALRLIVIMEALHQIFNLKNKNDLDLTNLVVNWRKALTYLDEGDQIDSNNHIKMLIVNNIQGLKQKAESKYTNE